MAEHAGKPKVRFAGFTETWEQRKLGEIGTSFDYGLNAAAKPFDGKNRYIRITDIDDNSRSFLQTDLTSPDTNLDQAKSSILQEGDIVFARTGASVGKTYIYNKNDGLVYFAGFLIRVRVKPEYNVDFVFQNTLTKNYAMFINITSQRSGQPGVNAQEYASFTFLTPTLPEQARIGAFFRHLDRLVALHQRKRGRLENIKKAMLEKMFPKNGADVPEVRFAGFTEAWEQRKLGDFTDIRTGPFGSTLHAKDYVEDGIPIITTEHFKSGALPVSKVGIPQISKKDYERLASYILEVEDIVFSRVGSVDMNALISEHQAGWVFSGRVLRVRLVKNDSRFLHTLLETENVKNDIKSRAVGQTMPCINTEILKSTEISLSPSRQEQVKIGTFFRQLDRLVTLHQRKVALLQNIKKACLEKMFV